MKQLKKISIVLFVTLMLVGCDLTTKEIARDQLRGEQLISYMGGTVKLVYAENIGGMLSLGSGVHEIVRFLVFRVFVAIVLVILFFYIIFKNDLSKLHTAAMVLVLGGGIGNLINRFFNDGRVIDFLVFELFGLHTGIFNLADVYVTIGISYLLLSSIISKYSKEDPAEEGLGES